MLGAVEASARAEGRLPELMPWELAGISSLMAICLLVRLSVCPVPFPQLGVGVNTHSYSGAELGTAPTMCSSALDLEMCCCLEPPPPFKQGLLLQLLGVRGHVPFGRQTLQGLPWLQRAASSKVSPLPTSDDCSVGKYQRPSHVGLPWDDSEGLFGPRTPCRVS